MKTITCITQKILCWSAKGLLAAVFSYLAITTASCKTVKPYQRSYLNDAAMQTGKSPTEQFGEAAHNYREGASGGGSGKGSGGCGCN